MIVSEQKHFIYVRIPKTASTSVSSALEGYHRTAADQRLFARVMRRIIPNSRNHLWVNFRAHSHWGLQAAREVLPRDFFASAFKFAVGRHPFSRMTSVYNHVMRHRHVPEFADVYAPIYRARPGLNRFVAMLPEFTLPPQASLLIDYEGRVLANAVIRMERMAEETAPIFARLGIEAEIPRLNEGGYTEDEALTDVSRAIIRDLSRIDFEVFGYDSEGLVQPRSPNAAEAAKWGAALARKGAWDFSPWEPVPLAALS